MKTTSSQTDRRLLRTMYPDVYHYLIDKLKESNIHSFDVQITGTKMDSAVEIHVRFGDGFTQEVTRTFSEESLRKPDSTLAAFCDELQETCKQTLIADYFKMVRP